jgi:hypothetical protein
VVQRLNPDDLPVNVRGSYNVTNIGVHPEEADFLNMMALIGVFGDSAMQLWLTLLEGFQVQEFLNQAALRGHTI